MIRLGLYRTWETAAKAAQSAFLFSVQVGRPFVLSPSTSSGQASINPGQALSQHTSLISRRNLKPANHIGQAAREVDWGAVFKVWADDLYSDREPFRRAANWRNRR